MPLDARTAARNNAEWCDIVYGSHGLTGRTDADAWSVPHRSPQWYPDAVTLRPGVDAEAAPLVGYETTPDLAPALAVDVIPTGPLQVWLRD